MKKHWQMNSEFPEVKLKEKDILHTELQYPGKH